MTERYLRYRRREHWGPIDELADDEYRSYADGSIRRFRYTCNQAGKKTKEFVGSRTPLNADWVAFFAVIDRCNAWRWTSDDIQPVPDAASWSLRIKRGKQELRVDRGLGVSVGVFRSV